MAQVRVASVGEIGEGQSKLVDVNGIPICLVKIGGELHAISNNCPHVGGPLNEGIIDNDKTVMCPWHGWTFSLVDGKSPLVPTASVPIYKVEVKGEDVLVEI